MAAKKDEYSELLKLSKIMHEVHLALDTDVDDFHEPLRSLWTNAKLASAASTYFLNKILSHMIEGMEGRDKFAYARETNTLYGDGRVLTPAGMKGAILSILGIDESHVFEASSSEDDGSLDKDNIYEIWQKKEPDRQLPPESTVYRWQQRVGPVQFGWGQEDRDEAMRYLVLGKGEEPECLSALNIEDLDLEIEGDVGHLASIVLGIPVEAVPENVLRHVDWLEDMYRTLRGEVPDVVTDLPNSVVPSDEEVKSVMGIFDDGYELYEESVWEQTGIISYRFILEALVHSSPLARVKGDSIKEWLYQKNDSGEPWPTPGYVIAVMFNLLEGRDPLADLNIEVAEEVEVAENEVQKDPSASLDVELSSDARRVVRALLNGRCPGKLGEGNFPDELVVNELSSVGLHTTVSVDGDDHWLNIAAPDLFIARAEELGFEIPGSPSREGLW